MRVAFPLVLQSPSSGSAIVGATATITQHVYGAGTLGTGAAATIYTSDTGAGTVGSNAIQSDNLGRWTQGAGASYAQYWLDPGTYDIQVSGTGLTTFAITREIVNSRTVLTAQLKGANYTAVDGDMVVATAVPMTVTLPTAPSKDATVGILVGAPGASGASPVTVARGGTAQIYGLGLASATSFPLGVQGAYVELRFDGTNWGIVTGQQDTGWVAITLPTNFIGGVELTSARLIGDHVRLKGVIQNGTGSSFAAGSTVGTVAAAFRPAGLTPVTMPCFLPSTPSPPNPAVNTGLQIQGTGMAAPGAINLAAPLAVGQSVWIDGMNYSLT